MTRTRPGQDGRILAAFIRAGGRCYYCGERISIHARLPGGPPLPHPLANWDHKVPRSRGGGDGASNRVAACQKCDSEKGALTDTEYFLWKQGVEVPDADRLRRGKVMPSDRVIKKDLGSE